MTSNAANLVSNVGTKFYDSFCPSPHITYLKNGVIREEKPTLGTKVIHTFSSIPYVCITLCVARKLIMIRMTLPLFIGVCIASRFYANRKINYKDIPQARIGRVLTWTGSRKQLEWDQGWATRGEGQPQGTCLGIIDVALGVFKEVKSWVFSPAAIFKRDIVLNQGRYINKDSLRYSTVKEGIAISMFQSTGLGTPFCPTRGKDRKPLKGECDWTLKKEGHKTVATIKGNPINGTTEVPIAGSNGNDHGHFIDILGKPDEYIRMLKDLGCNVLRFSLERSVIQPEKPTTVEVYENLEGSETRYAKYNTENLELYRNFLQKLLKAGIEPDMTLCHFVHPKWFTESLGFENDENRDGFIQYGRDMIAYFPKDLVKTQRIFNEINVDVVQKYIRGVYPPRLEGALFKAANVAINMFIAHAKIFMYVKDEAEKGNKKYTEKVISSSLQWLKFKPMEGNIIERIGAYIMNQVFFTPFYNFFESGVFSVKVPFLINRQFVVSKGTFKKYERFLDESAGQFYGFVKFKFGLNGGEKYPGREGEAVHNYILLKNWFGFTFGSTCHKKEGSGVMSFGPGFDRGSFEEEMHEVLHDLTDISKPVVLTPSDVTKSNNRENWKKIALTEVGGDGSIHTPDNRAEFRKNPNSIEIGDALQKERYKDLEEVLKHNANQNGLFRKKIRKKEVKSSHINTSNTPMHRRNASSLTSDV